VRRHINASFYYWTPETAIDGSSVYAAVQAQKPNTKVQNLSKKITNKTKRNKTKQSNNKHTDKVFKVLSLRFY